MTNTTSETVEEQPSTLPDLNEGDSIKVSVRSNNTKRTLEVDEIKDDCYILTGYGTRYKMSVSEKSKEPDWVMIYWKSTPEGEIVTDIEVENVN